MKRRHLRLDLDETTSETVEVHGVDCNHKVQIERRPAHLMNGGCDSSNQD